MSLRYHRLKAPSFDLCWFSVLAAMEDGDSDNDESNSLPKSHDVLLVAGGGGSTKSGVKNQIQLVKIVEADKVEQLDSYITDTPTKNRLCSGVITGTMQDVQVAVALLDSDCLLLTVEADDVGNFKLARKLDFKADFAEEESSVNGCLIARTGHIITGGQDHMIRIWKVDVPTERDGTWMVSKKAELRSHSGPVVAFNAHPTENWVLSASKDGSCKLWDLANKLLLADIPCCVDGIAGAGSALNAPSRMQCRGCSFSLCGDYIYTIQSGLRGASHLIKWWIKKSEESATASSPKLAIASSSGSSNNSSSRKIKVQVLPEQVQLICAAPSTVMRRSADGCHIAVGSSDGSVHLFDTAAFKKVLSRQCHDLPVTGVDFAPESVVRVHGVRAFVTTCSPDRAMALIRIGGYSFLFKAALVLLLLVVIAFLLLYSSALWLIIADSITSSLL